MQSNKLVVLGSINADHILNVQHFPRPGETVTGSDYQVAFGGKGANQAVAAGRSGADITFIACVGNDDIGDRIIQQLTSDRIDVRAIEKKDNTSTGVALIFVNQEGENVIGISAGANACLDKAYVNQYQQIICDADALLIQLETPVDAVESAATLAKQHHTQVVLNPAPARKLSDHFLAQIDVITPNETEAEILTGIEINNSHDAGEAARILHEKGIKTVIITMGSKGAWVSIEGEGELITGFNVKAIDTIAAGDTFNGAFITAWLEGKKTREAIRFAHAAAALAVTRKGAQPSVPWREEIEQFLQSQE